GAEVVALDVEALGRLRHPDALSSHSARDDAVAHHAHAHVGRLPERRQRTGPGIGVVEAQAPPGVADQVADGSGHGPIVSVRHWTPTTKRDRRVRAWKVKTPAIA